MLTPPHRLPFPVAALLLVAAGCSSEEPLRVGYLAGLTGRTADLGIAGREGVTLAVEEQNRSGGVHGRPVRLAVEDCGLDPDRARRAVDALHRRGVTALIGPMTSTNGMAIQPQLDRLGLVAVAPTVSTNRLTGRDDGFFRIYPCSSQSSRLLAEHVRGVMKLTSTAVIYDTANMDHTRSAYLAFRSAYEKLGGRIGGVLTFASGPEVDFLDLARRIGALDAACLFILANALDTATLCQQMAKVGVRIQVVATDWSATDEVIQHGGRAVDGLFFLHTVNRWSTDPDYRRLVAACRRRYGHLPGFATIHAYDATRLLLRALDAASPGTPVKEAILAHRVYRGVQGEISLDRFGDVKREHHPMTIREGRFREWRP